MTESHRSKSSGCDVACVPPIVRHSQGEKLFPGCSGLQLSTTQFSSIADSPSDRVTVDTPHRVPRSVPAAAPGSAVPPRLGRPNPDPAYGGVEDQSLCEW